MKYIDLDNIEHKLNLGKHLEQNTNKSSLHIRTRNLLKKLFPLFDIFEECPIKVTKKQTLYLDFLIPELNMIVEPCGKQHYERISFFQTKIQFIQGQKRDRNKQVWACKNRLTLVELRFDETEEQWKEKLLKA